MKTDTEKLIEAEIDYMRRTLTEAYGNFKNNKLPIAHTKAVVLGFSTIELKALIKKAIKEEAELYKKTVTP